MYAVPRLDALARLHEGGPDVGRVAVVQGGLDLDGQGLALGADAIADAGQAGGDDAGVIEDQGVAGAQEVGQVANDVVGKAAVLHHQQP
eukprot:gene44835-59841_t